MKLELQPRIINIYNHLYANSSKKTPLGISTEIGKILHTGMFLEETRNTSRAFDFDVKQFKRITENHELLEQYGLDIRNSFQKMNDKWRFYETDESIEINDFDLIYCCQQLDGIKINDEKRDVFGDTIEIVRSQWAKQIGGQFFTDSQVTSLAMTLLNFDPRKGDDLVDICAGTGGFLLAGLNHIRQQLDQELNPAEREVELVKLAKDALKGQEIDSYICQIANSTLSTRLGEHENPFVENKDSLIKSNFNHSKISFNSHYCVASNPPFGTKITIKDSKILNDYELAKLGTKTLKNNSIKLSNRAPDILFIEQNVKLLIPGKGRLSIVVPYQIVSGPQTEYVRKWLLQNTIIESIIDLPSETFQPHTGTKTCLLTLKRRKKALTTLNDVDDYEIFMSIPKHIGHDRRGTTIFKKTVEGKLTDDLLTDIPMVKDAYEAYKVGKEFMNIHADSFVINCSDILSNPHLPFNAQYHKPSAYRHIKSISNEEFSFRSIHELVKEIFYPGRFKRDYVSNGPNAVPFFGGADINQLTVNTGKWISKNHPKIDELSVKARWIIITRSGSTGIASIVPERWDGFAMSEHIIRIVPNEEVLNPLYLLSYLRSNYCQEQLKRGIFGSVIDEIEPNYIGKILVPIPNDKELLNRIISDMEYAEKSRNEAITVTSKTMNKLNSIFDEIPGASS